MALSSILVPEATTASVASKDPQISTALTAWPSVINMVPDGWPTEAMNAIQTLVSTGPQNQTWPYAVTWLQVAVLATKINMSPGTA